MPPRKRSEPPAKRASAPRKRTPPARRGSLAAVPDDAAPPPKPKPLTLEQAVETGKYLEIIRAQRRALLKDLADAHAPAAKASMHRQLATMSKEIEALEEAEREQAEQDAEAGRAGAADAPYDAGAL